MKITLLSTANYLMIGNYVKVLKDEGIEIDSIVFDEKEETPEMLEILKQRIEGRLQSLSIYEIEQYRIPCFFVRSHSSESTMNLLNDRGIDIAVNAGTPRILTNRIFSALSIGVLNCHPGILPDFKGCNCVEWAIYHDKEIGNTVHIMTEEIDEGPVIAQQRISISQKDTYEDIRAKVHENGFQLLAESIKLLQRNGLKAYENNIPAGGRYYHVMEKDILAQTIEKANKGLYKFQNN